MLRGFLGFTHPPADGCVIDLRLPADFPALTIDQIRVKGLVLSVTASRESILVRKVAGETSGPFTLTAPGYQAVPPIDWAKTTEEILSGIREIP